MSRLLQQRRNENEIIPLQSKKNSLNATNRQSYNAGHNSMQMDRYGSTISSVSNFSIQYNLGVIAPALLLLDHRTLCKLDVPIQNYELK